MVRLFCILSLTLEVPRRLSHCSILMAIPEDTAAGARLFRSNPIVLMIFRFPEISLMLSAVFDVYGK
ncbi:hypothetical protein BDV97DRAFT_355684 [Delphinella strobiligena]|nr:hypothetical protein BDV97DRAFT_355684 [Delphinella strobiligena]